ncbi:hypothetical protein ACGF7W_08275 [Streptomyces sp. NPDC048219]|uniref:hypothetical protein n=1 Tax=Streptomyces sp. NPDC048219 TaxID=3365517 RepID=UPI0037199F86
MSSIDHGSEHLEELTRLADERATRPIIECCPHLLALLPPALVPAADTPLNRARAFYSLLKDVVREAQSAYDDLRRSEEVCNTLAVGALFGLVTWRPDQPPGQRISGSSGNRDVRQGIAGEWLDPDPGTKLTQRTVRERKTSLLKLFQHTLYDHVERIDAEAGVRLPAAEATAHDGPGPRPEPVREPQPGPVRTPQPAASSAGAAPEEAEGVAPRRHGSPRPWPVSRRATVAAISVLLLGAAGLVTWWALSSDEPAGDPVSVDDVVTSGQAASFVLPLPLDLTPAQLDQINHDQFWRGGGDAEAKTFSSWLDRNRGAQAEDARVNVTLSGTAAEAVRITRIDVEKRECRDPAGGGTLFYAPVGGSGEDKNINLSFDLDAQAPFAADAEGQDYFAGKSVVLAPGETETLSLYVRTRRQDCRYSFLLRVVVPGAKEPVVQRVPQQGAPFRLTALAEGADPSHPYSPYRALYVGGAASPAAGAFVRADPLAYTGDPATLAGTDSP